MTTDANSAPSAPIRVLLVDDQQLMLDGISMLLELETGIELIAQALDGIEAVRLYAKHQPDVVLMDIEMPNLNGIEACSKIRATDQNAHIIILTTFGQEDYLRAALLAGANGFLLKAVSGEELAEGIRKVYRGAAVIDAQSTAVLLNSYRRLADETSKRNKSLLSTREEQILKLIAQKKNNRSIAIKLELAEGTVKNYVSQILEKLHVRDRNQAVQAARDLGLMD